MCVGTWDFVVSTTVMRRGTMDGCGPSGGGDESVSKSLVGFGVLNDT
jgi:hypothetical protein